MLVDGVGGKSQANIMLHSASPKFWHLYGALPTEVKALADKSYQLLKNDPRHPSLRFKKLDTKTRRWSVRVGDHYRALGVEVPDGFLWVWIGTHAEYDGILK